MILQYNSTDFLDLIYRRVRGFSETLQYLFFEFFKYFYNLFLLDNYLEEL